MIVINYLIFHHDRVQNDNAKKKKTSNKNKNKNKNQMHTNNEVYIVPHYI